MSQMNESEMARRSVYSSGVELQVLGKGIPHGGRNVASVTGQIAQGETWAGMLETLGRLRKRVIPLLDIGKA